MSKKIEVASLMTAEQFHLEHSASTAKRLRAEFDAARKLDDDERRNATFREVMQIAKQSGIRIPAKLEPKPTNWGDGASIKLDGATIKITINDKPEKQPIVRATELRANAFNSKFSGAEHFGKFVRVKLGMRTSEPLPQDQLSMLWSQWIDFTCGVAA